MHEQLTLLSGRAHPALADEIAAYLGISVGRTDISNFPDGEISLKLACNVRGCDVFLIQPTGPPVNDNLVELLVMVDACKRASAERITVVIPYFGYARQDRKDTGRVPITSKLVANLIVRAGADRVLAMDLHAAQIQGFFDVPVDHLYSAKILDNHFKSRGLTGADVVVVSPDEGSIKRALQHQDHLDAGLAIIDKRRTSATETKQANLIGESLDGKTALIFDDMISTAGSICGAARVAKQHGAKEIYLAAAHGIFCGSAPESLAGASVDEIVVTNSLPPKEQLPRLRVVSVAPLLGEAIRRIHRNESVSHLFS